MSFKFTHFVMGFRNIFYSSHVYNFFNCSILYFLALCSFRYKNIHNKFQRSTAPPSIPTLTNASTGSIFLIPHMWNTNAVGQIPAGRFNIFSSYVRIRIHSYHGNQLLRLPRSIQISAFLVLYSKCCANKNSAQYVRFYLIRHDKLLYKDVYWTLCTELFRRFSPNISRICSNLR